MSKPDRALSGPFSVIREGEGVALDVVRKDFISNGQPAVTLGAKLHGAPVPDRRYSANFCGLKKASDCFYLLFGQKSVTADSELRSLLSIRMSFRAAKSFVKSLQEIGEAPAKGPTLEGAAKNAGISAASLDVVKSEPAQTVAFDANMVAAAFSDAEACLDFYYASPFSVAEVSRGRAQKLGVDPIVRVIVLTAHLLGLYRKMCEDCVDIEALPASGESS